MIVKNNYFVWNKGEKEILSPNFNTIEFECSCNYPECKEQRINIELISKLTNIRSKLQLPIKVTSAYRCGKKQEDLRKQGFETTKGISQHQLGNAVDINCTNMPLLEQLCDSEFLAMGIAKSFIHVDMRSDYKRRWKYK